MTDIRSIKQRYIELTKNEEIGGANLLNKLSDEIKDMLYDVPTKYIVPLFVLHKMLKDIALYQDDREVTVNECRELYTKLHKPILKLLSDLEADEELSILLEDCAELISTYYIRR